MLISLFKKLPFLAKMSRVSTHMSMLLIIMFLSLIAVVAAASPPNMVWIMSDDLGKFVKF